MGQIIHKCWLTFLLLLITFGVSLWTIVSYQQLSTAIQLMQTPVAIMMPTPLPPTPTSLPPTPQGPLELILNRTDFTLSNPEGETLFELNDAGKWVPVVSVSLASKLPPDIQPRLSSEGIWVLLNEEGQVIYRWNTSTWEWLEASISSGLVDTTEGMPDKYSVILPSIGIEELLLKTDEELLSLAPGLDPGTYNVVAETLVPYQVLRIGENGDIPYLIYADQEGRIRMAWNIQKGEVEHAELSTYIDKPTNFVVDALLVTDNSWLLEEETWFALNEPEEGTLAKVLFEYPLALNNIYTNHNDYFKSWFKIRYRDEDIWSNLDRLPLLDINDRALQQLRSDISLLPEAEKLGIKVGVSKSFEVDNKGLLAIFRINYNSNYSLNSRINGAYNQSQFFIFTAGSNNNIEINIKMDRSVRGYPAYTQLVGGALIAVLREITVGGESRADIRQSSYDSNYYRTTTDQLVFELCGVDLIKLYLKMVGGEFQKLNAIPHTDYTHRGLPLCGFEKRR